MQQVLVEVFGLPIYGYGMMLFLTFVICTWMGTRWANHAGLPPEKIQDLAIVIFLVGILGARITYILVTPGASFAKIFKIWEGGLVFYGSAIGATIGYLIFYRFILRKYESFSGWKLADIIAPIICVGLALGRIGCLLNGCCYGHTACPDCAQIHFPLPTSPARDELVGTGIQTSVGFSALPTEEGRLEVTALEPHSTAAVAGLREGDHILQFRGEPNTVTKVSVDVYTERVLADEAPASAGEWREAVDQAMHTIEREAQLRGVLGLRAYGPDKERLDRLYWSGRPAEFAQQYPIIRQIAREATPTDGPTAFRLAYDIKYDDPLSQSSWSPGQNNEIVLQIERDGEVIEIEPFVPRTVGLYPTQINETISMMLLLVVLLLFFPLRRHDGQVMVLLMVGYAIHRFTNEQLRDDTDPIAMNLTLSQLISIGIFTAALMMEGYLRITQPKLGEPSSNSNQAHQPTPEGVTE